MIFIHGGPVPLNYASPTEWGQYQSWGRLAAASGFTAFTFDHSYTDFAKLEEGAADVASAVDYIRSNASKFLLDPDRLCLWACSGGGPLLSSTLRDQPDYISCIVVYYAYMDLRQKKEITSVLPRDVVRNFSPAAWISDRKASGIPILVVKAALDDATLNESIDTFIERAFIAEWGIELTCHKNGHHGFDVNDDDSRSREIIAQTLDFMKSYA